MQSRWHGIEFDESLVVKGLGEGYRLEAGRPKQGRVVVYDSYNRKLQRNGLALLREGWRFRIVSAEDLSADPVACRQLVKHRRPVFHWDFKKGPFRNLLRQHLQVRAAVPLATVVTESLTYRVRNQAGKGVMRLLVQKLNAGSEAPAVVLEAIPLRGHEREAEGICHRISGLKPFGGEAMPLLDRLLKAAGKLDPPPSVKDEIMIERALGLRQSVSRIAAAMIRVARQNEPGVIEDIDTDFLHDYRVAIRRLRSVVSLLKGAFSPEETRRIKAEFKSVAQATNRLRDLDVYLLGEEAYRKELPKSLRSGLDPMFEDLAAERRRALGRVRRRLKSPRYQAMMESYLGAFERLEIPPGRRADEAIAGVVEEKIRKHYKHVRRIGRRLDADTPDAKVHGLRIECKKLRYLLELFAALYRKSDLEDIVPRLKGLQNVLGDFNDFSVQSASMLAHADREADPLSSSAMEGLIEVLDRRKAEARAKIAEQFAEFSDGKMGERFDRMFAHESESI